MLITTKQKNFFKNLVNIKRFQFGQEMMFFHKFYLIRNNLAERFFIYSSQYTFLLILNL